MEPPMPQRRVASGMSQRRALKILGMAGLIILALVTLHGFTSRRSMSVKLNDDSMQPSPLQQPSPQPEKMDPLLQDVLNATLGFQKIFVLSMPSATDRRDIVSLAAAMTGLQIEFIDGVTDFNAEKALPYPSSNPGLFGNPLNGAQLGSWRGHMNAIRAIVDQNLTSALILEDDGDWDVRIKTQMQDFARASRLLLQPVKGTNDQYIDTTRGRQSHDSPHIDIPLHQPTNQPTEPTTSPYGDISRWDVLWVGHCGMYFAPPEDLRFPLGRVIQHNDSTVVQKQHYQKGFGCATIVEHYPERTRATFHARQPLCNLAYGVSLHGARRLLWDMGVDRMTSTTDQMLQEICSGSAGRRKRVCLGVQPPLFVHHYRGSRMPFTANIVHSAKVNLGKLVEGETDYVTNWPDGEPMPTYPY